MGRKIMTTEVQLGTLNSSDLKSLIRLNYVYKITQITFFEKIQIILVYAYTNSISIHPNLIGAHDFSDSKFIFNMRNHFCDYNFKYVKIMYKKYVVI